jgi:hypothetical protein
MIILPIYEKDDTSSGLLLALTSQLNFTSRSSYHLVPQNKNIEKG